MDRPAFTFCICPDSALIRDYIRRQLENSPERWSSKVFWGDEELPESFWESLTWTGLLGESTAVVLRRAEKVSVSVWKSLHPVLSRFRPKIWPFFCIESEWSRGKPQPPKELTRQKYWEVAGKKGWIWQSPGLNREAVIDAIRRWGSSRGIAVPERVAAAAADSLPPDAGALFGELEKLELYLGDRSELSEEDLAVLASSPDLDVFAFLRALQAGGQDYRLWKKMFRDQMSSQDTVLPFLGLMLREARLLWQLASGEGEQVRLPPRVRQEKANMARKLGLVGLARIWTLLMEAETGIKSGQRTPDQAMEMLVSGLLPLFR